MGELQAIRCDHDGLKMAEVKDGHLILRTKHHGETHVKIVSLGELVEGEDVYRRTGPVDNTKGPR
ncbi:MAG: hypothetical protein IH956_03095 [Chloroflexi bacterium]|nr:hypothetical protein [Chloroflexota bacterium]